MRGEGGKGSIAVRKHESSSQSCEVCECVWAWGATAASAAAAAAKASTEQNPTRVRRNAPPNANAKHKAREQQRESVTHSLLIVLSRLCALCCSLSLLYTLSLAVALSRHFSVCGLCWHPHTVERNSPQPRATGPTVAVGSSEQRQRWLSCFCCCLPENEERAHIFALF